MQILQSGLDYTTSPPLLLKGCLMCLIWKARNERKENNSQTANENIQTFAQFCKAFDLTIVNMFSASKNIFNHFKIFKSWIVLDNIKQFHF